eukprot:968059-Amorphochlora_amoeboformis.AAC.1
MSNDSKAPGITQKNSRKSRKSRLPKQLIGTYNTYVGTAPILVERMFVRVLVRRAAARTPARPP